MATPQARKLGLREGTRVALVAAPRGWTLNEPPDIVRVRGDAAADVVVAFAHTAVQLTAHVDAQASRIFPDGALWLAWPRRAAGHDSDITDNRIREVVLPRGLVDVKVAAIDEDWSAIKVVWRRENRT